METVCYDISSLIRKKLALKKCPSCQADLKSSAVEHSPASRAFEQKVAIPVIATCLSQCPECGWWAVRELRSDDQLYNPPVEEFIVMPGVNKGVVSSGEDPAPWEQVLVDKACWKEPVPMQATEAIELFGSSQMLLPNINRFSRRDMVDRIKSVAPILLPVLFIILIAVFFSG